MTGETENKKQGRFKTLGVRAASGIGLMVFCGFPVYYGGWAILALASLFGIGMIWEWVRMTDVKASPFATFIPVAGLIASLVLAQIGDWKIALGIIGGVTVLATCERIRRGKALWAGMGVLYILLPCLAIIWLRGDEVGVKSLGFAHLIFISLVVIAADTMAYIGGSTFKGPKLAPKISPNKTWSGFICGLLGGVVIGAVTAYVVGLNPVKGLLFAVPIVLASVFGDLLESAIKRHLSVKDAGDLIPGHGGILDRVDSLMMALIVAVAALLVCPNLLSGNWPV
ncbi:MAG: phosphatidate cytidylyltransferase [Robiginitomaculum sp.]|nr:MAG: phosphatidate cytidylyltransferase [Robiginitomaculum sp.]